MEQELLTLPEHMNAPRVFGGVRVARSLVLCVVDRCLSFCYFFLAIVFSVLFRFAASDYPFVSLKMKLTLTKPRFALIQL